MSLRELMWLAALLTAAPGLQSFRPYPPDVPSAAVERQQSKNERTDAAPRLAQLTVYQGSQPTIGTHARSKPVAAGAAARKAARDRQIQCAREWNAARASGKVKKNAIWPKFFVGCNKRLMPKD